jgi:hypothetical protein
MLSADEMAERLFGSPPAPVRHSYSGLIAMGLLKPKAEIDTRSAEEKMYDNTPIHHIAARGRD